jgi:LmbE family N-acetylglucosaminyl deacetylase
MKNSSHSAPTFLVSLALLLAAAAPLAAQITPLDDPANLAGERVSAPDLADTLPINHGALALQQLLRKLRTRASFMLIVAHPDDEDNGMLTYLSRGQGARVATLTLNRGEGGQNLMSADFDGALGLIRTQELLAADRYMGVDQFFGTEVDFGFSKTKEEAFAKWTHERVLYDAVRAVRLYRPLVIASVFIGAPSDGHGQHQVSGQIAQEVFNAAGDPSVFPDQIAQGLQPWQPLKVYARSPFGRIDAQGMYDYATGQYVPARFHNYVTGKVTDTTPKANVTIPEGDTDPLLGGISYAQLGREGRSLHRSQMAGGGGGPAGRAGGGRFDVSYHRYGSHLNQPDGDDSGLESGFFDGIDTTLPGIATLAPEVSDKFRPILEKIDRQIAEAQRLFDPNKPELTAPPLREALRALDGFLQELENSAVNDLPPTETFNLLHELRIKRVQLNNALVAAEGLSLKATLSTISMGLEEGRELLTSDRQVSVKVDVQDNGAHPVTLHSTKLVAFDGPLVVPSSFHSDSTGPLLPSTTKEFYLSAERPEGFKATRPYFGRKNIEQPFYDVSVPALRNAPSTPSPIAVEAEVLDNGVKLDLFSLIEYANKLRTGQALSVVPPFSVSTASSSMILRPHEEKLLVTGSVRSSTQNDPLFVHGAPPCSPPCSYMKPHNGTGSVHLSVPQSWDVEPESAPFTYPPAGEPLSMSFSVIPGKVTPSTPISISEVASYDRAEYSEGYRAVGYPGLVYTNYYTNATLRVVPVDVTAAANLNVAYLPGTGDDIPAALDQLGVHPHLLTAADLTPEILKPYDAVILGVRAYEHSDLAAANPALNAYAAAGGVVIAQYNTGRLPEGTGPYPLSLGGAEKVVEENAPVRLIAPDNPLLTWPNKITSADFDGWVEERGHGFMDTWDQHYIPLLETHDPGQQPQLGGLLVARTGRGAWIYLGLALYRQLPEGVPGSYRLFANLISAAKNPQVASPNAVNPPKP